MQTDTKERPATYFVLVYSHNLSQSTTAFTKQSTVSQIKKGRDGQNFTLIKSLENPCKSNTKAFLYVFFVSIYILCSMKKTHHAIL